MFAYFKNKDIVRKVVFTMVTVAIFRFVAVIPIPGIPRDALKDLLTGNNFVQVIGLLSGGMLQSIGILTIGLGPYINASYIFQLLSVAIPQIKELYQGGPVERKMLTLYTRLLSIPLAIIQSVVIYTVLNKLGLLGTIPNQLQVGSIIALLTFGSVFAMWLGELITEFGMGGGTSVIILAGILVNVPIQLVRDIETVGVKFGSTKLGGFLPMFTVEGTSQAIGKFALLMGLILGSLVLAIIISLAIRKIKLIYARRVRPSGIGGYSNYIPLSINTAGVMPVIFAISILDLPRIIFQYLGTQISNPTFGKISTAIVSFLSNQSYYNGLLMLITMFFAFFSAYIVFRPEEVAENINKQGAFIDGVRPGKETQAYLNKALWTTTLFGAILLAVIVATPNILVQKFGLPQQVISGTGSMIMAGVIMDMVRQVQAMKSMDQTNKNYY
ncbi:preprotein translocase subunit SecY [Candidatus Dojkabacteria bacterium CG_4_9_14_3_um_filter_150_Dojkabacteria_WS6_41_13]|uniref:Protein translocase subunit SecY n=1 Tax=Candidatus Dojkabacteria bacterium CG_4_10_14_0_2_um_filter_Dojkabacteria_WS6_41_15 TaxID=2014249 RepID=A0A2M7W215_9BACT|nr:MAG: preprotein translocase subunit SecY [Candidatus Dojkabacteria bacterium CG_4_10_14_3_um_filter_Dojkabacteria_WS6_41_9]PJA13797.1 MAG: preprotein translocase subunit SecY [Candidatus Dojkabacteria bacterium CG_4_10_14_0_2_um_filter_Dojkabacteria_WS6_41_15]PJB22456.1 MAG: preprotein translocase subunit SecY [Candidatus Dojkabacteria bacterium CG_4_9_14_3_um_filter_150_Dojkabacteria_WS6_41_13]